MSELAKRGLEASSWCVTHGLLMGTNEQGNQEERFGVVPVSLVPAEFPQSAYEDVKSLSSLWNSLYDSVARHPDFLENTLAQTAESDEFTRRLLQIYRSIGKKNLAYTQPNILGIFRSDYMLHRNSKESDDCSFFQVELNTIASAFAHLSGKVSSLHRFLEERFDSLDKKSDNERPFILPDNKPIASIAGAIAQAVKIVHPNTSLEQSFVLIVVQPAERNSVDQRGLEYALWDEYRVPTIRKSLVEILESGSVDPNSKELVLEGKFRVSVVYFRAGYSPKDYPTDKEWRARELLEESRAIKCPNIAYHLAGAKRIQQQLSSPDVLAAFLPDEASVAKIMAVTAQQWNFDQLSENLAILQRAISTPDDYVLKPQREGGGNNFYGKEMVKVIQESREEKSASEILSAYVLMQRLKPPPQKSVFLKNGRIIETDALSELGIYSCILSDGKEVVVNEFSGHLVRTKAVGVDEGGVATGYSVLDSPRLILK